MTNYHLELAIDQKDLARRAVQIIASHIDLALDQRERAQIALSGGSTPSLAYSLLGQEHLPWSRVDVFLGDERWVDPDDESSNARMIRRTLLSSGPGSEAIFHPVPTIDFPSPKASAEAFSALLKRICVGDPPIFDLLLLGLGDDGHTASLFPETDALNVLDSWATVSHGKGLDRITLTSPVLSSARKVIFMVSGAAKQNALIRLLNPLESIYRTPAKLVQPHTEVLVLADEAAAALV